MSNDLHRSVWLAYRRTTDSDGSRSAVARFQAAVDAVLRNSPGVDASSACKEAARMVMMPPLGAGGRRRARPAGAAILPFPALAIYPRREARAQGRH
ncbi:MAG TPA: hypothetical protein VHT04_11565 [Stellaceae bacterium]|jgi:hypothetical protein|nr:hypothetical protein [Stellaceae bacterium]